MKKGTSPRQPHRKVIRSEDGKRKSCSVCREMKLIEEFSLGNDRSDGRKYECRPCHAKNNSKLNDGVKRGIFLHYSPGIPKCACCGESNFVFLTLDHINNDGAIHRKTCASGSATYYWIRRNNYPPIFQVLCWNCQHPKAIGQICPHQIKGSSCILTESLSPEPTTV